MGGARETTNEPFGAALRRRRVHPVWPDFRLVKPVITGVSSSASGAPAIASGSWVSIYGAGLSATTRSWKASDFSGTNLPTVLDNVSVQINGKKAAISYVSPGMLNVLAPTDTTIGPVPVRITNSSGTALGTTILQKLRASVLHGSGKICLRGA